MTPKMPDWFRSAAVLSTAFVTVALVTIGLAAVIVPNPAASAQGSQPAVPGTSSGPLPSVDPSNVTAIGGALAVTGDREATFVLDREAVDNRYALAGPDGRIVFEGDPLVVTQVQYDGLEFFLDPDECTITPGERHDPTGVAGAHVRCEDIADVRDQGVVSFDGTVGLAADLFGLRGDLPDAGGSIAVGEETWTFDWARMTIPTGSGFSGVFIGQLYDIEQEALVVFSYDAQNHELSLSEISFAGETSEVPDGACTVGTSDIGLLNPHTRVAEMTVRCAAIEVPTLGMVPIEGSLIVELSEPPG